MLLRTCLFFFVLSMVNSGSTESGSPPAEAPVPATPSAAVDDAAETAPVPPAAVEEPYQPPFPQREELFQPPSFNRPTTARQDNMEVALKGFIDVGGQKVLLSINGRVKQLAVGESAGGIEVIRIDPPKVTLQRGRVRWTDTLFEVRPVPANDPALQNTEDRAATLTPPPLDALPYHAEATAVPAESTEATVGQGSP